MVAIARKDWRRYVGFLLAAFYVLALATPVTAIALSADLSRSHCLNEIRSLVGHDHSGEHADHQHRSSPPADQTSDPNKNCCGLFGVSAIAPNFAVVTVSMVVATSIVFTPSEDLLGRGFDRIDRPPRPLLSL